MPVDRLLHTACYRRRAFLGLALTGAFGLAARAATDDAAALPPSPDDHFVFLSGPKKQQVVLVEDLALGGPQIQAFPAAPDGTVRNASRLNLVVLARFDPAALTDETRAHAADGVVAYSAICTHQGCDMSSYGQITGQDIVCLCHGSEFGPTGAVIHGPAKKPLVAFALALGCDGDLYVVRQSGAV